jgi:hypothetical protein
MPQRGGEGSAGRSRPPAHHPRCAPRHACGQGTGRRAHRGETTFAGAATTTPPARARGQGGARRRSLFSSRSQRRIRWGRSLPSRCLPAPAMAGECRSRQPSASRGASTRCTSSSDWAPIRLRWASDSQRRAASPSPADVRIRKPASGAAPAPAATSPSRAVMGCPRLPRRRARVGGAAGGAGSWALQDEGMAPRRDVPTSPGRSGGDARPSVRRRGTPRRRRNT